MAMKTYSVTMRDGQTESRKSARPYTHAVVVVYTEIYLEQALGKLELEMIGYRATIAAYTAAAATDEDKAAYAAASARFAYLNEPVTEQHPSADGATFASNLARWLTDEFRAGKGSNYGLEQANAAADAIMATAQGKINRAEADIRITSDAIARAKDRIVPGRCYVEGWSMSGANAMKMAAKADRLCHVYMTDEIAVREHAPRAKKAVL